jgi:octaprenyl-diphosphate synthase
MTDQIAQKAQDLLRQRGNLESVYGNIRRELEKVEQSLHLYSSSPNRLISEISTYLFQKKGKRIRPALLLLSSGLFRGAEDEHIRMAALVEFIHTASLIHDDIIDNADLRRGRESVHARWGPNISVLLGDYLYIRTIGLSLQSQHPQIIRILTDVSARMIEGELTEYHLSGNLEMTEEDYFEIIRKKTASLFAASCQIGAVLSRSLPHEEAWLVEYGLNLGMAFQMVDDLLDFRGAEKDLGKPVLSDLSEGRITLPLIYSLRSDGGLGRDRLLKLMKKKNLVRAAKQEILELVKANGALDYTFGRAEEFSRRARQVIAKFPDSENREALSLLAECVLNREK